MTSRGMACSTWCASPCPAEAAGEPGARSGATSSGGLAAQQSPAVTGLRIDSEVRRGRDYVRVVIVATAEAADVAVWGARSLRTL